jgi:hypothetical protein
VTQDLTALHTVEAQLVRYGFARDRKIDREPRQITISDDEAVALIRELERLRELV